MNTRTPVMLRTFVVALAAVAGCALCLGSTLLAYDQVAARAIDAEPPVRLAGMPSPRA